MNTLIYLVKSSASKKNFLSEIRPRNLFVEGEQVLKANKTYFQLTIKLQNKTVILNTAVDQNVFNGEWKTFANDSMFMSSDEIRECITSIKLKNWNGLLTLTLFHQLLSQHGQESLERSTDRPSWITFTALIQQKLKKSVA